MACAAIARGDQIACGLCGLTWDRSDTNPPPCGRDGGPGKDVSLRPPEVKGLKLAEADWQPRKRGGFGRRGGPKISFVTAAALVTLKLCFYAKSGALRSTSYGSAWLDRNTRRRRAGQ